MDAVINLRHEPKLRESFEHAHVHNNTMLVDRRTRWGNPFRVGRDGSPDDVVARYRADLWRRIRAGQIALEDLAELDGMWLACWCLGSHACHAEVLARAAAWAAGVLGRPRCGVHGMSGRSPSNGMIARDESRILDLGRRLSSAMSTASTIPLQESARYFVIHLDEDPRGPVREFTTAASIRETASETRWSTHIRCGIDPVVASDLQSATHGMSSTGFRAMPSARAIRCNLRSQAPSDLRFYPYRLRSLRSLRAPLARMAVRAVHPFEGSAGRRRQGGPCGWREISDRRDVSLCHTCSLRKPAARVLHSAPLRCGRDSE